MNTEKNVLKKNEKRKAIWKVLIAFVVTISIDYMLLFPLGFHDDTVAIIIIVIFSLLALFHFGTDLLDLFFEKKPSFLNEELEKLREINSNYFYEEYEKQRRIVDKNNKTCPHCGNNNDHQIVDRIARTKGKIKGDFSLGFGSVHGRIDTSPVNHCNNCGNEWLKETTNDESDNAMNNLLKKMYEFFNEGKDNNSDPLKKFSAKAIKQFIGDHSTYGYKAKELAELSAKDFKKYGCS